MALQNPYPVQESELYTQEFEDAVANYIQSVIQEQKKIHDPTLEPFDVVADRIRESLSELWHTFRKNYVNGYTILLEEMAKTLPDEESLAPYYADSEKLNSLQTVDGIADLMEQGRTIYMLLGYSSDVMQNFYRAAYKLLEEGKIEKGYYAFFYLVTIAPNVREFWLNYGYAALQMGEDAAAIESYGHAYELDKTKSDSYLAVASVYIKMQHFDKADAACELGIRYAQDHRGEEWAEELGSTLEEAKRQIAALRGS